MKNISDKSCSKNQNTHIIFSTIFPENPVVFEITWRVLVDLDGRQMAIRYDAEKIFACRIRKEIIHLLIIFATFFTTATMDTGTRLIFMFHVHCMSYLF